MSIAMNTTPARAARAVARPSVAPPMAVERPARTQQEQLRGNRALLRHFVLAFTAVSAVLYAAAAGGPGF